MSSIDSILSKEGKDFVRNVAESVGYSQSKIADIFKNDKGYFFDYEQELCIRICESDNCNIVFDEGFLSDDCTVFSSEKDFLCRTLRRTLGLLSAGCHLKDSSDRTKGRVLTYKLEKLKGFYGDLDESGICNRLCDYSFNIEADEVSQSRAQEQIFISGRRYISGICIHASAA